MKQSFVQQARVFPGIARRSITQAEPSQLKSIELAYRECCRGILSRSFRLVEMQSENSFMQRGKVVVARLHRTVVV